nr:MAG TPA: hypothetical protein [Caudoviricetes sp.]
MSAWLLIHLFESIHLFVSLFYTNYNNNLLTLYS